MDRNSVTGFILMALVLFGFTFLQSKKAQKQYEFTRQQDSLAMVQAARLDSLSALSVPADGSQAVLPAGADTAPAQTAIYRDACLEQASKGEGSIVTLHNDKFEVAFNTRGAQPWSVRLNDFKNYGGSDLYVFRPGDNRYAVSVYVGQYINTADFEFQVAEHTDSTLAMRLPFADGGYIEQRYAIAEGSYGVSGTLSFIGMNCIPRNVSSIDLDIQTVIPRMEKGYKNESQYSKLDYWFEGDKKPEEMGHGRSSSKDIKSRLSWFAFQQQFFSVIVDAPRGFANGKLAVDFLGDQDADHRLMSCTAAMRMDIDPRTDNVIPLDFYFGPNHFKTLKEYDRKYEKIIPLGGWLVGWFTRFVIIPLFDFLHRFIDNFGLIILIMTILIKLVVFPLTYKSLASSAKMSALKPEIEKINAKYPKQEDALKKQQATMDLYKLADCSPMGGCLPTLLTFPILWAMFRFFPASIELRQQRFLWAEDLSGYDSIVDFGTRVPLLGDHLSLFALLMALVMILYSKFTTGSQTAANDPSAATTRFMSVWIMPIMMFFICNNLSSGLSYYYLLSQLIAVVQMFFIRRSIKPEKVLATVAANRAKPVKARPKSKWQQRLEEAQRMQEQQLRQQQRRR